jgi:hypothetical protein
MDQSQFWCIIEQAKGEAHGDLEAQVRLVENCLQTLSLGDIATFEQIYLAYHDRSCNKLLWEALNAFIGFVSDDSFHYFRSWLISRGEGIFCEVMRHPARVSEFVDPRGRWTLENLNYAAHKVYERRTNWDLWEVLRGREEYPLAGYDWLQPTPFEE